MQRVDGAQRLCIPFSGFFIRSRRDFIKFRFS